MFIGRDPGRPDQPRSARAGDHSPANTSPISFPPISLLPSLSPPLYRLAFPSLAFPALPPLRLLPARGLAGRAAGRATPSHPAHPQVQLHVAARLAWGKAAAAAHRLDFDGAVPHAHTAARSARAFRDLAAHTEKLLLLR